MQLPQHILCTRKTELALETNIYFDFHHLHGDDRWPTEVTSVRIPRWRPVTRPSDCCNALLSIPARVPWGCRARTATQLALEHHESPCNGKRETTKVGNLEFHSLFQCSQKLALCTCHRLIPGVDPLTGLDFPPLYRVQSSFLPGVPPQ